MLHTVVGRPSRSLMRCEAEVIVRLPSRKHVGRVQGFTFFAAAVYLYRCLVYFLEKV